MVDIYLLTLSYDFCLISAIPDDRGISDEALELSDLHCSIPMKGMVDSFNVSVAAGILMHHAVCDRTSRLVIMTFLHNLVLHRRESI